MKLNYTQRREKIYDWMASEGISFVLFEDCERSRDQSVRYLSGQPGDALLLLSENRRSLLIPWDVNMAALYADADDIIPYNKFELNPYPAVRAAAAYFKTPYGAKVEVPAATSYPDFLRYVECLSDFDVICRSDGAKFEVDCARAVKDEDEMRIYRACAEKTNEVIELIEESVRKGGRETETESGVALFIEAECRKRGCDGTGFGTLAAGPERSFGIHCFPPFTGGPFGSKGLSILDFGLVYCGYTSDVTLTVARSPSKIQEKQLELVEEASNLAISMLKEAFSPEKSEPQMSGRDLALAVDALFKKNGVFMPHGLGHGIGLEAHEAPYLRRASSNSWQLERGNIVTVEPGLYDPTHGGCRLENDVLLGQEGAEVITRSLIIRC